MTLQLAPMGQAKTKSGLNGTILDVVSVCVGSKGSGQ